MCDGDGAVLTGTQQIGRAEKVKIYTGKALNIHPNSALSGSSQPGAPADYGSESNARTPSPAAVGYELAL